MDKLFYDQLRLGILGGGQLGKMLLQKAADFNISTSVLDPDEEAPARFLTHHFAHGSFRDFDAVYRFGQTVDLLTIEIEHVNVDALDRLDQEGLIIYPQPGIIRLVQDKGAQKVFYKTHGIPTADFHLIQHPDEIGSFPDFFPCIQKLRTGGYDGRGVQKLDSINDLSKAFDGPSVLERAIEIDKEISILVARSPKGETKVFPAVEMEFNPEANLVEFLFSPATISPAQESVAATLALKVAESLNIIGLLAVELFLSKDGEWLVNEIAPRPHNSGHHTIEACATSQYEQHLRAILNLPLGDTTLLCPAAMLNILGEKNADGPVRFKGIEKLLSIPSVSLHLYGKKTVKPFRKMGHMTLLGKDLASLKEKADLVRNIIRAEAENHSH